MLKIIYIHHYFSKSLFYKIAHNTIDREYYIDDTNTGYIIAKYKNNEIKFVFDPTIHYKNDGFHIIDYFSAFLQKNIDTKFKNIIFVTLFISKLIENSLLSDKLTNININLI